ncbi:hypothetical protein [Candidatus Stoquefichus massiliensis]|uniref:hypothetical protein n=1 Tax=Candidatus Stoquefichus massiliensis TaxID=1470350 RepID=UPI000481D35F|nr:hypothetical protein [Candidatus Stoquefichus massiliensis]
MINENVFFEFYREKVSSDIVEMENEYRNFKVYWDEFIRHYSLKEKAPDNQMKIVQLAYMYAIIWDVFSISAMSSDKEKANNLVFSSLATTISNDILAIIKLSMDGLDYQAMNILRNLYEISLLILNICIDEEKREKYVQSASEDNSYEVWIKYFNISAMLTTISNYTNNKDLKKYWMNDIKRIYSRLSSFTHNSLLNVYVFSFSLPKTNHEKHVLNSCAHYVARYEQILTEMVEIIWMVTRIFKSLLEEANPNSFCVNLLGDNTKDCFKAANNYFFFADYCFLKFIK